MIALSREAERHVAALLKHYAKRGRPEASEKLFEATDDAVAAIEREPQAGLTAPRPHCSSARPDRAWMKAGR